LPAAHAPIHLLDDEPKTAKVGAQASSVLIHAFIFGFLILFFTQWPVSEKRRDRTILHSRPLLEYRLPGGPRVEGPASFGTAGGGGDHNPRPASAGNLPSPSRIELAPPRLPDGRVHPLPQPNTIFSEDAPELATPVNDPGLPWKPFTTDSAGPGLTGIGNTPGDSLGRNGPNGNGEGDNPLAYSRVASQVLCRVCPDPLYSDEARKIKVQGSVLLSVFVGPDGRAKEVRIMRGLGWGLDENAVQAVRNW